MVKFEVCSYSTDIRKIEVDDRETEKSIFIRGNRRAKITEYSKYFDTFEDAKSNLVERCKNKLERASTALSDANKNYRKALFSIEEDI